MAFQQHVLQEGKPMPSSASTSTSTSTSRPTPTHSEKPSACFDCNICLDFARDPVVTLCGHLYCWPCIFKWFNSQTASLPSGQLPQCPVCKAETSAKAMVPVYGRGRSLPEPRHEGTVIPPRPPAGGTRGLTNMFHPGIHRNSLNHPNYSHHEDVPEPPLRYPHPVVGMLAEMVYARAFGDSGSSYTYPNSYYSRGNSTPRLRRYELEAGRSLNRVTIFLFCCSLLCLLLF